MSEDGVVIDDADVQFARIGVVVSLTAIADCSWIAVNLEVPFRGHAGVDDITRHQRSRSSRISSALSPNVRPCDSRIRRAASAGRFFPGSATPSLWLLVTPQLGVEFVEASSGREFAPPLAIVLLAFMQLHEESGGVLNPELGHQGFPA